MKKNIYILLFALFGSILYAQTCETVIAKLSGQYTSTKNIQFNMTYSLYKNATTVTPVETYKGSYYKNAAQNVYMKINETEFLNTKMASIKVSHDEKIMVVANPAPGMSFNQDFKIDELLKMFNKHTIKDKKTHWEIELYTQAFSSLPYSKIILYVGKDYYLQKQVFFYSTGTNFSKSNKADIQYPKLEVIFSKPVSKEIPSSLFDTSKYLTSLSQTAKLSPAYSNYELLDQRKK